MRSVSKLALAGLVLVGISAFAAYDSSWYQANFWSGEYATGFSIVRENVLVPARSAMDLDLPISVQCALPYKAVYHPWNSSRQADYHTASKIVPMTTTEEVTIGFTETVTIPAGEVVEYLIYGAEGMFFVRYKGVEYEADQDLFTKVAYDETMLEIPQDEWLNVTCLGGESAWIFLRDLVIVDAEGFETYLPGIDSWSLGFRDYGLVTDLTDEDLKKGK